MKLKFILFFASALSLAGNSFGQYFVTTGTTKYALLEEATGPGCGYCPDGAQDVEQTIKPMAHAIAVSWHGAYYDATSMVVTGDPFCAGTGFIAGFPEATIDRTQYPDPQNGMVPAVGLNRSWESFVTSQLAKTAKFSVEMRSTYNSTTRVLTVSVTGTALSALTGSWNISALVAEDSISSNVDPNYNQHSYLTSSPATACNGQPSWWLGLGSPITPATKYWHNQVVRALLSTTIWGDASFTNPAAGTKVTKTYTYTIPAGYVANQMKVVGFVAKYGSTTTDRAIENAIQTKVKTLPATATGATTNVTAVKTMADVRIYPNPAKNFITVTGVLDNPTDTKIVIYNSLGQVVKETEYKAGGSIFGENISLNELSNGTYFMDIVNNGERISKQFTINK